MSSRKPLQTLRRSSPLFSSLSDPVALQISSPYVAKPSTYLFDKELDGRTDPTPRYPNMAFSVALTHFILPDDYIISIGSAYCWLITLLPSTPDAVSPGSTFFGTWVV